jgi:hypothetical protein
VIRKSTCFRYSWRARAALIILDLYSYSRDPKPLRDAKDALAMLAASLEKSCDQTTSFHVTVTRIPRLTSVLNRAKRDTTAVLEELVATLKAAHAVISEALKTLEASLDKAGAV